MGKCQISTLNDSGPQGSTIGLFKYLAQSNENADSIDVEEIFKFIEDLTILDIVNLLSIGISSFNTKLQVPNYIPIDNGYIDRNTLKSQSYNESISDWNKKEKNKNTKFTTRLQMEGNVLPVLSKTWLLRNNYNWWFEMGWQHCRVNDGYKKL